MMRNIENIGKHNNNWSFSSDTHQSSMSEKGQFLPTSEYDNALGFISFSFWCTTLMSVRIKALSDQNIDIPKRWISTASTVAMPFVSGRIMDAKPARRDMPPMTINGRVGCTSFSTSAINGAVLEPTRARREAKLIPWVLKEKGYKLAFHEHQIQ